MGIWVFYPWHKLFLWVLKFIFQCAERRFSFDSRSSYLKIILKIFTHFCSIFMHWCYLHINLWSIWNLFWFKDPDSFVPRDLRGCPSSCLPRSPHWPHCWPLCCLQLWLMDSPAVLLTHLPWWCHDSHHQSMIPLAVVWSEKVYPSSHAFCSENVWNPRYLWQRS